MFGEILKDTDFELCDKVGLRECMFVVNTLMCAVVREPFEGGKLKL